MIQNRFTNLLNLNSEGALKPRWWLFQTRRDEISLRGESDEVTVLTECVVNQREPFCS